MTGHRASSPDPEGDLAPGRGSEGRSSAGEVDAASMDLAVQVLRQQFPWVPLEVVVGVLADSQSIVQHATGAFDTYQASALARLRLEILTERPAEPGRW